MDSRTQLTSTKNLGLILPIHPRHYQHQQLDKSLRAIRSTLEANGWQLNRTLYLDTDTGSVPDRECWTIGRVKTTTKGYMTGTNRKSVRIWIDWQKLISSRLKTPELRSRLLSEIDRVSNRSHRCLKIRLTIKKK